MARFFHPGAGRRRQGRQLRSRFHYSGRPIRSRRSLQAARTGLLVTLLAGALASAAWAHTGPPPRPGELWQAWTWDPWVLLGIGVPAWLYARGVGRLWRRAGVGRGVRRWEFRCFCAGLAVLFLALVSPLHALGTALFSAHMLQHEMLILVAAPLLALGSPLIALLWGLPRGWRRRLGRWVRLRPIRASWAVLRHPLGAWTLHAVALWIWHAPAFYQATLRSELIHLAQHVSFFASALLFWWVLLELGRNRLGYGTGVLLVFTTALHSNALGALLTFAPQPWYPAYALTSAAWGLSALEDQQLGGLIMWIPAGLVYVAAALILVAAWLQLAERRARGTRTSPLGGSSRIAAG